MRFRAFGEKHIGHGHVKRNMSCEDYALSYNDPQKRFFIGAACDGHSDNNCFRSAAGARFGCESAVSVLRKFFDLYYMQPAENRNGSRIDMGRVCRAIKQLWDRKVMADIRDNPLQDHELAPLTEKVRNYYLAGNGLNNIYGATFLAVAACEDFFLALHVGDGIILCIGKDGRYYEPLPEDPRSQTGAPASLCDSDLFTRDQAFRYVLMRELPMAAVVSSDGIQDCLDDLQYIHFVHDFFARIIGSELPEQVQDELNDEQKAFLMDRLTYYAGQGHGAEDDCSFAGFYDLDQELPDIRISNEIIARKWEATAREREHVIRDYEERKSRMVRNVREQERNLDQYYEEYQRACRSLNIFGDRRKPAAGKCKEAFEKLDELVGICCTIDENERAKSRYYDARLESLRRLCDQPDHLPAIQLTPISQIGLAEHTARRKAAEDLRKARTVYAEAKKAEEEADKNFKAAMDHNVATAGDQAGSGQGVDLGTYTNALQEARVRTAQAKSALENSENEYRETIPEKFREILKLLDSGNLPDPPADDPSQGFGYG
ncbi:MAG: protein phosphatase 2C domain-containing protein, partial [Lachnospiraceae bacterium]